jgi:hypothetical protein
MDILLHTFVLIVFSYRQAEDTALRGEVSVTEMSSRRVKQSGTTGKAQVGVLEQVQLTGAEQGLSAALHVELAIDVVDVLLDGANRDDEPIGDRLIGMPIGDQAQDLVFARAQQLGQD